MNRVSLRTRSLTSNWSSTSLLKHRISLVSPSVLAKQKSCCSQPLLPLHTPPQYPLRGAEVMTVKDFNYRESFISSDIILDNEMNAWLCKTNQSLAECQCEFWTSTISVSLQNWKYKYKTIVSYFTCTHVRHGLDTKDILWNNWNISIYAAYDQFWISPTCKSWIDPIQQASKP